MHLNAKIKIITAIYFFEAVNSEVTSSAISFYKKRTADAETDIKQAEEAYSRKVVQFASEITYFVKREFK